MNGPMKKLCDRHELQARKGGVPWAALLLSTTALWLASSAVEAAEWSGAISSDWFTAGNWNGGVPTNVTFATIDPLSGAPAVIDAGAAVADGITIGLFNAGDLTIRNGGTLTNGGLGNIANGSLSSGLATVTGAGSTWNNLADTLGIGTSGDGELHILDGGKVNSAGAYVGYLPGSVGNVVITGAGSALADTAAVHVGHGGTGSVSVSAGGALLTNGLTIGTLAGSLGGVTISGSGSSLTSASLRVGDAGSGTLRIEDGAAATVSTETVIGFGADETAHVWIEGAGTTFTSFGDIEVGAGSDGHLSIADGASMTVSDVHVGSTADGGGRIQIGGAGAVLNADDLFVGAEGGGFLQLAGTAGLNTANASIGFGADATGFAVVTGASTSWVNGGDLFVGYDGEGFLSVSEGAALSTGAIQVGFNAGSEGGIAVSGPGSTVLVTTASTVGGGGEGSLGVTDGASVDVNDSLSVGLLAGGLGSVLASGAGTMLSVNNLLIADQGGAVVQIQNGALLDAGNTVTIASQAGSTGFLFIGGTDFGGVTQAAGTLLAPGGISFGDGDGKLIFQHTGTGHQFDVDLAGSGTIVAFEGVTIYGGNGAGFTGTTEVYAGATLEVASTLNGVTEIAAGGLLRGSGTLQTVDVQGTVAPGSSIGTMTAADITFAVDSVYEVEVDGGGNADRIALTGAATLAGGTVRVLPFPDYATGTSYTIVTAAGGVTGAFGEAVFGDNSIFILPTLAYDATNVYLSLAQTATFTDVALTPNQIAAAGAAEALGPGNQVFDAIIGLGSAAKAQAAFDAVSGEIHASSRTALIEDSEFVRQAVYDRLRMAFDRAAEAPAPLMAYGDDAKSWVREPDAAAVWGQAIGSWSRWDTDGNAAALDSTTGGFIAGTDASIGEGWLLGMMAGYSRTEFDADDRASTGGSDDVHLGAYAGARVGGLGLRLGAAYTWHDVEASRTAAIAGFADSLAADYDAGTTQVFAEAAHEMRVGASRIEPFANLAYVGLRTDAFTETGGAAAVASAAASQDATFTTLGLRGSSAFIVGDATVTARGSLAWRHAFGDVVPVTSVNFAGADAFSIAGVAVARDALMLEAGLDMQLAPGAVFGASYSGQWSDAMQQHALKARLGVRY